MAIKRFMVPAPSVEGATVVLRGNWPDGMVHEWPMTAGTTATRFELELDVPPGTWQFYFEIDGQSTTDGGIEGADVLDMDMVLGGAMGQRALQFTVEGTPRVAPPPLRSAKGDVTDPIAGRGRQRETGVPPAAPADDDHAGDGRTGPLAQPAGGWGDPSRWRQPDDPLHTERPLIDADEREALDADRREAAERDRLREDTPEESRLDRARAAMHDRFRAISAWYHEQGNRGIMLIWVVVLILGIGVAVVLWKSGSDDRNPDEVAETDATASDTDTTTGAPPPALPPPTSTRVDIKDEMARKTATDAAMDASTALTGVATVDGKVEELAKKVAEGTPPLSADGKVLIVPASEGTCDAAGFASCVKALVERQTAKGTARAEVTRINRWSRADVEAEASKACGPRYGCAVAAK